MTTLTVELVATVLAARANCRGDLLGVMPETRRKSLNFIKKHRDEIEAASGRKLRIASAHYTPSGRGAFGRLKGGRPGCTVTAGVYFTS